MRIASSVPPYLAISSSARSCHDEAPPQHTMLWPGPVCTRMRSSCSVTFGKLLPEQRAHSTSAWSPPGRRAARPRPAPASRRRPHRSGRPARACARSSRAAGGRACAEPSAESIITFGTNTMSVLGTSAMVSCGTMLTPVHELAAAPGSAVTMRGSNSGSPAGLAVDPFDPGGPQRVVHAVDDRRVAFRENHDADAE